MAEKLEYSKRARIWTNALPGIIACIYLYTVCEGAWEKGPIWLECESCVLWFFTLIHNYIHFSETAYTTKHLRIVTVLYIYMQCSCLSGERKVMEYLLSKGNS